MNERQRDLFLWQWSRRRRIGQTGAVIRGLLIGAAAGLVFAVVMGLGLGEGDNRSTAAVLDALRGWVLMLGLAVPAFAGLMAGIAGRVYASHEALYQDLLRRGARVPETRPRLQAGDRGPQIAVYVAVAILVGLVIAALVLL